jgi:hypothetical protein
MPRGKTLNNIAAGVLSSFVSRNSDISGYFGRCLPGSGKYDVPIH